MYVAILSSYSQPNYSFQFISKFTEIERSDKDYNVKASPGGKIIQLSEINNLINFQRITCQVKVLSIQSPVEVPGGKKKQDIMIGDSSGTTKLTIWEEEIGKMKEEQCYKISGVVVRDFKGMKFLSTSKQDLFIAEEINDIGRIQEDCDSDDQNKEGQYRVYNSNNVVKVFLYCIIATFCYPIIL